MSVILPPERIALLRRLDPEEIVAAIPDATEFSRRMGTPYKQMLKNALAGAHKARVMGASNFTTDEVKASKEWLLENDYKIPEFSL